MKIRDWVLALEKEDKKVYETSHGDGERLVVSYSEKRAKKDAYNRNKGVERLRKSFKSGKITKDKINKRGYNKFLEISKGVEVTINQEKIDEDAKVGWPERLHNQHRLKR